MDLQSETFLDWPSEVSEEGKANQRINSNVPGKKDMLGARVEMGSVLCVQSDTTFETHYSISDLAEWLRLGRETVRLLIKDEPGVVRVRLGRRKAMTRYSVPESVARRVHTRLFYPAA